MPSHDQLYLLAHKFCTSQTHRDLNLRFLMIFHLLNDPHLFYYNWLPVVNVFLIFWFVRFCGDSCSVGVSGPVPMDPCGLETDASLWGCRSVLHISEIQTATSVVIGYTCVIVPLPVLDSCSDEDGNGVHSISEQLASRCGYTISTFKMDGFTTFRASYYSCFTHNQVSPPFYNGKHQMSISMIHNQVPPWGCAFPVFQNDEVFTFSFNVMVNDAGGQWLSQPVSAVCSGLNWTHREIICEEDYMEVRTLTSTGGFSSH